MGSRTEVVGFGSEKNLTNLLHQTIWFAFDFSLVNWITDIYRKTGSKISTHHIRLLFMQAAPLQLGPSPSKEAPPPLTSQLWDHPIVLRSAVAVVSSRNSQLLSLALGSWQVIPSSQVLTFWRKAEMKLLCLRTLSFWSADSRPCSASPYAECYKVQYSANLYSKSGGENLQHSRADSREERVFLRRRLVSSPSPQPFFFFFVKKHENSKDKVIISQAVLLYKTTTFNIFIY